MLAVSGCDGCNDKKAASGPADASEAGAAVHGLVVALPGCHAVVAGGSVLEGITPGLLSIAALHGRALVASSPVSRMRAGSIALGPTGAPEGTAIVLGDSLDDDADAGAETTRSFPAAVTFGNELATMAYASRRASPTKCGDGELVVQSGGDGGTRRALLSHVCRPASGFRAATRGKLGIAIATSGNGPSVEAWLLDGTDVKPVLIDSFGGPGVKDAGVGALAPLSGTALAVGSASVAAAYVLGHRTLGRELRVARLGAHGEPAARVEILEKDRVESVALAFEDETLHVVWSVLVPEKKRHVLRWSKWPAGGVPTPAQSLGTGVLSATKPALAIDHGRFVLAWTEGDDDRTTVKVGASRLGLAPIAGLAAVVSSAGAAANHPAVALDGDALFVAWSERRGAEESTRASALTCVE